MIVHVLKLDVVELVVFCVEPLSLVELNTSKKVEYMILNVTSMWGVTEARGKEIMFASNHFEGYKLQSSTV
jgi:hypothetical protein